MLFTQLIKANLQTEVLGREIDYYVRLESTNTEAVELMEAGAKEGTLVVTDNQTAGRGRHDQSWFSGPGKGLAFSVILRPGIGGRSAGLISLMGALAVADAVEKFQLAPQVKWPNDILLSGKKCGGVLVETKFKGDIMSTAVMGIGINVNETEAEFPEELRPTTTSILMAKESPAQRELALAWTLNSLEQWYERLKAGDRSSIIEAWKRRCAHLGKNVSFIWKREATSGVFLDVSQGGEAIIRRLTDSHHMTLSSEEISLIREA
ncbi:MAG: biotin--[acetyl-CoA-carboxylase] ligase [Fidelibacterota bacterium]